MEQKIRIAMRFFSETNAPIKYFAQEAIGYTLSKIKHSSNLIADKDQDLPEYQNIFISINKMRAIEIAYELYSWEWIQEIARLAEQFEVGNCCEKACVAFNYLQKLIVALPEHQRPTLELFNNPIGDHFFVVIGRSQGTDSADPRTWNPSTVICDPWAEGKGYAIGDVNFNQLSNISYRVIQYLVPENSPQGELMLQKDVLGTANNNTSKIIIAQDQMVLRARFDLQHNQYARFNTEVPIAYELWDYPEPADYKNDAAKQLDHPSSAIPNYAPLPKG